MKKSEENKKLQRKRESIDKIDNKIIILLSERLTICSKIAQHKKKNGTPIRQEEREEEILNSAVRAAIKKGIDKGFITSLFKLIMKQSRAIQKEHEEL